MNLSGFGIFVEVGWAILGAERSQVCLLPELERRAGLYGTRDSLTALEALSSIKCRTSRKKCHKGKSGSIGHKTMLREPSNWGSL